MNRKWLAIGIILLFLGVAVAPTMTAIKDDTKIQPVSDGITLYVGGSGPGNYTKIQDAIAAAHAGDTVYVYHGTYNDHVNNYGVYIDKSINLLGENKYTTIINATGNLIGVKVFVGGV
ncbi:MAG: hypothetical protein KKG04_00615, partial [Candidatus Thermoplasmatota archaeon]|nr:hypothetical protein [Candidatus Thermoplasmatota archaeon]